MPALWITPAKAATIKILKRLAGSFIDCNNKKNIWVIPGTEIQVSVRNYCENESDVWSETSSDL